MIICVRGELEPFARVLAVGSGSWLSVWPAARAGAVAPWAPEGAGGWTSRRGAEQL